MAATASPARPGPIRWRRIVHDGDAERIRALVAATGAFDAEEQEIAGTVVETTLAGTETYRFLLAERDGELLGYTCFDRIPLSRVSFDLYWIAVRPEDQGTGLAGELVARTASFCKGKGGTQLFAEAASRPAHAQARAFLLRAGFAEAARLADFYEPGDARIIYRLAL